MYRRITRAYCRLRLQELVKGEYYRDEKQPEVYLFDGSRLVYQSATPHRRALIIAPPGLLERCANHMGINLHRPRQR